MTHFLLPPAARVEFLVKAPAPTVRVAQLVTQNILSGPLATIIPHALCSPCSLCRDPVPNAALAADGMVPAFTALDTAKQLFGGIMNVTPAFTRTVYFAEDQDNTFFINASGW